PRTPSGGAARGPRRRPRPPSPWSARSCAEPRFAPLGALAGARSRAASASRPGEGRAAAAEPPGSLLEGVDVELLEGPLGQLVARAHLGPHELAVGRGAPAPVREARDDLDAEAAHAAGVAVGRDGRGGVAV